MRIDQRPLALALGLALGPLAAAAEDPAALEARLETLEQRLEALAEQQDGATAAAEGRTHLGGYGELHYNRVKPEEGETEAKVDFHRFVLFIGHDFSDRVRFVSEVELEHSLAGDGKPGEVELEQAYVEFDHAGGRSQTRAGLFLVPVGLLNETHEPTSFYGVERNDVEGIIIPTTWWEAGVQHIERFGDGWQWDIALHSGLAVPTDSFRIRSGRQKVAEASGNDLALTNRLEYSGVPGLKLGAAVQFQSDASQADDDGLDEALLTEVHAVYHRGRFGLRALWAQWSLAGENVEGTDAETQSGWYVEPSLRLNEAVGLYLRASRVDAAREQDRFDQIEAGVNWWPHENVVFKADLRRREHDLDTQSGNDALIFDLGVGYHF